MKHKIKLFKDTAFYSLGTIIPQMLNFILLPVFTRFLSPDDYGIIYYTNSVVMFIFVLSTLALNTFLLRYYFEYRTADEKKRMIGNTFVFILFYNLLFLAFSLGLGRYVTISLKIKVPFYPFFFLALINNFFNTLSIVPLAVFRVKKKARAFVLINSSRVVLSALLALFLIVRLKWGVLGKFYGELYVNILFSIIYFIIVFKNSIINLNLKQIKKALRFSLPLLPGAFAFLLIDLSDRVILERFISLSELGIYSVAYTIAFSINFLIIGGYQAFEPVLFEQFNKKRFPDTVRFIKKYYMYIIFITAFVLAFFSLEVFRMMATVKFYRGYLYVPLFVMAAILKGEYYIVSTILIASKKTFRSTLAVIIGGLGNIILNLWFIPRFGVYGAAFAKPFSFLAMFLVAYLFLDKDLRLKITEMTGDLFSFLIGSLIVYFTIYYFHVDLILRIVIFIILGLVITKAFHIKMGRYIMKIKSFVMTGSLNDQ
ncbi:MAG: oligosaccharide flippase family protein [Spirochaetes bacterium]|nr:oligosaccharide flippase family protein [Spirochaetota bacterium]